MQRIHILGAAGAGKTTLGRALAGRIGCAHADTDDAYWLPTDPPFREKRPVAERVARLRATLDAHARCILTGSLSGWGDELVPLLDGVALLDTPVELRLQRLAARERERYGAAIDLGGACHEAHAALMEWAAAYDAGTAPGRSRERDGAWIVATGLPRLCLDGRRTVAELVDEVQRWVGRDGATDTALVELVDDDLAAMLRGDACVRDRLVPAPGGVDDPLVLAHVRTVAGNLHRDGYPGGQWMVTAGGEIVGLIGIKRPPSASGEVEIGYGIAASRRRRGHATRAVAAVLDAARRDPAIRLVTAATLPGNAASQRALARNGFERTGTRMDPDDGELVVWQVSLVNLAHRPDDRPGIAGR